MATLPMGQYAGTAYYSYDGVRKWRVWFVENGTKAWVLGWYGQFEIPEYKELPIQPATEEELNALTDAPPISDPWYIINRIREAEAAIPPEERLQYHQKRLQYHQKRLQYHQKRKNRSCHRCYSLVSRGLCTGRY